LPATIPPSSRSFRCCWPRRTAGRHSVSADAQLSLRAQRSNREILSAFLDCPSTPPAASLRTGFVAALLAMTM
jgi:hypothetical protein